MERRRLSWGSESPVAADGMAESDGEASAKAEGRVTSEEGAGRMGSEAGSSPSTRTEDPSPTVLAGAAGRSSISESMITKKNQVDLTTSAD